MWFSRVVADHAGEGVGVTRFADREHLVANRLVDRSETARELVQITEHGSPGAAGGGSHPLGAPFVPTIRVFDDCLERRVLGFPFQELCGPAWICHELGRVTRASPDLARRDLATGDFFDGLEDLAHRVPLPGA